MLWEANSGGVRETTATIDRTAASETDGWMDDAVQNA